MSEDDKEILDVSTLMINTGEREYLLSKKVKDLDEALESVGVGFFHFLLIFVAGWALASDSVEVQCISFVTPQLSVNSTEPDHALILDDFKKGVLDAIIFLGMMVGGYFWGSWSDVVGRRSCLITSLTFNGAFGLASSFSPNFEVFLFFRFMSGVGVGGSLPVAFSYFCEFFSKKTRGPFVIILAGFWMLGSVFASLLALGVIEPLKDDLGHKLGSIHITSWRVYIMLCTIPALSSALFLFFLPESPSFLFNKAKIERTLSSLNQVRIMNSRFPFCYPPLKRVIDHDTLAAIIVKDDKKKSLFQKLTVIFRSTIELFSLSYLRASVVLCMVWFAFSFGYYGLLLWFPEYFKRIQDSMNVTTASSRNNNSIYIDSAYTSVAAVPALIIGILTVNLVGGKIMLTLSILFCALSSFLIRVVPTNERNIVILSCLFNGIASFGWNALDVISTSELFPIHLRSTALGIQAIFGRTGAILGNLAFGKLIKLDPMIPIVLVAAILLFGGLVALFLPTLPGEGTIQILKNLKKMCHFCLCWPTRKIMARIR